MLALFPKSHNSPMSQTWYQKIKIKKPLIQPFSGLVTLLKENTVHFCGIFYIFWRLDACLWPSLNPSSLPDSFAIAAVRSWVARFRALNLSLSLANVTDTFQPLKLDLQSPSPSSVLVFLSPFLLRFYVASPFFLSSGVRPICRRILLSRNPLFLSLCVLSKILLLS